ncbi:hypothetical protein GCM10010502_64500 [Kitasatospora aureofaciens]|uniref:HTH araC/xylS-type domain-containing protein n=1 Tax=Kitasatospora aureofaciens TaxID=1894 RepID=A0A8H9LR26_KITAU|nr:hypothetical protein GCM10010502_64500 [Kitasatospora aureofaciens]
MVATGVPQGLLETLSACRTWHRTNRARQLTAQPTSAERETAGDGSAVEIHRRPVGYASESAFANAFKRTHGLAPGHTGG